MFQKHEKCYDCLKLLYNAASKIRSAQNKIDNVEKIEKKYYDKKRSKGFNNKEEIAKIEIEFEDAKDNAKKSEKEIKKYIEISENNLLLKKVLNNIIGEKKIDVGNQNLEKVNVKKPKLNNQWTL